MAIKWNDNNNVGIKIIDDQHKSFVVALNDLLDTLGDSYEDKNKINSVFRQIDEYMLNHFKTEEKYMEEFNYDGIQEHKEKHREFIDKLALIKEQYITNTLEATFSLADYLQDWLVDHVIQMDRKYVKCFHDHGLY